MRLFGGGIIRDIAVIAVTMREGTIFFLEAELLPEKYGVGQDKIVRQAATELDSCQAIFRFA